MHSIADLEAMFELVASPGEFPTTQTRHAPGRPDGRRVQLTLCRHFHGRLELVLLDQPVANPSGEFRLCELLDGGDDVGT